MEWNDNRVFLRASRVSTMLGVGAVLRIDRPTNNRRFQRFKTETGFPLFDRVGWRLAVIAKGERLVAAAAKLKPIYIPSSFNWLYLHRSQTSAARA